jgi:hypothetical protein
VRRVFVAYETVDRRNPVQRQAEIHRLEFPRVTPASQKCGASSRLRERPFEMFPRGGAKWAEHERYCDSIRTFPYLNVDCCLVIVFIPRASQYARAHEMLALFNALRYRPGSETFCFGINACRDFQN